MLLFNGIVNELFEFNTLLNVFKLLFCIFCILFDINIDFYCYYNFNGNFNEYYSFDNNNFYGNFVIEIRFDGVFIVLDL